MKKINIFIATSLIIVSIPLLLFWMYPINFQTLDIQIFDRLQPMHIIGILCSLALFYLGIKYIKKDDSAQGAFIIEVAIVILAVILKTLLNI